MKNIISRSAFIKIIVLIVGVSLVSALLRPVFNGDLILTQAFHIGPLRVQYYGLIMAVAVASAYWLARKRAEKFGLSLDQAESIAVVLIISGFIGARLYHVGSELSFYWQNPLNILFVWNGGLGIYGAILGGLIGLVGYAKYFGWTTSKIFNALDWLAPAILIGQVIGRFGNLFNYEAFGYPTKLPWKMFVPEFFRPENLSQFSFFHPLFLYEAVLNALILWLILSGYINNRKNGQTKLGAGSLFLGYAFLYTMGRFFLESYRTDSVVIGAFRLNSLVSLGLLAGALITFYAINYRKISSSH